MVVNRFEDAKAPEKQLKGRFFLIMTDQRALQELQNLFTNWKPDVLLLLLQLMNKHFKGE